MWAKLGHKKILFCVIRNIESVYKLSIRRGQSRDFAMDYLSVIFEPGFIIPKKYLFVKSRQTGIIFKLPIFLNISNQVRFYKTINTCQSSWTD